MRRAEGARRKKGRSKRRNKGGSRVNSVLHCMCYLRTRYCTPRSCPVMAYSALRTLTRPRLLSSPLPPGIIRRSFASTRTGTHFHIATKTVSNVNSLFHGPNTVNLLKSTTPLESTTPGKFTRDSNLTMGGESG